MNEIKYLLIGTALGFVTGFYMCWINEQVKINTAIGNSIQNMENLKRDCEKSLPRDKECVMVFDFVAAEADYE